MGGEEEREGRGMGIGGRSIPKIYLWNNKGINLYFILKE